MIFNFMVIRVIINLTQAKCQKFCQNYYLALFYIYVNIRIYYFWSEYFEYEELKLFMGIELDKFEWKISGNVVSTFLTLWHILDPDQIVNL